jgi:hypothetical protein
MDWQSLLAQIKLRYEALVAIEDEIGSPYSDRAVRNECLFNVVTEAIDGQVKQIRLEKENLIQECRDFITKNISMRKAMGEKLSIDAASVERIEIQKVCGSPAFGFSENLILTAIPPNLTTTKARASFSRGQL